MYEGLQNSRHEVNPFALFYYFPTIPTLKQERTAPFGCMAFHIEIYAREKPFSYKVKMRQAFFCCALTVSTYLDHKGGLIIVLQAYECLVLYINNYNNPFPKIKNRM